MAITTGLVLSLKISADGSAEVRIGPSPARKKTLTLKMVDGDGAAIAQKAALLAALAQAFVVHDEVVVTDAADDGVITAAAPVAGVS